MWPEWRFLDDDIHEARHHFAVEEAVARLLDEGHSPPTLRLRRVHPAVFVGVHQNTWSEVDVEYCRDNNIQVVRRMNGGGAVYQEMGSFCFSAFFPRKMFHQSDVELYRLFALPAIKTCADYGVQAHFQGRNDVLAGERKIYGSAQFSWYTAFVQSGTFLVNMNFDTMEHALTPPALKFAGKRARSIRERVISLSLEVGRELDTCEVMHRYAENFSNLVGVRLHKGQLTNKEQDLAAELLKVKYRTDEWNMGSRLEFDVVVADKAEFGVITLSAELEGDIIHKASISGDILLSDRQQIKQLEQLLTNSSVEHAQVLLQTASLNEKLNDALKRLLDRLAKEAFETSSARHKDNVI